MILDPRLKPRDSPLPFIIDLPKHSTLSLQTSINPKHNLSLIVFQVIMQLAEQQQARELPLQDLYSLFLLRTLFLNSFLLKQIINRLSNLAIMLDLDPIVYTDSQECLPLSQVIILFLVYNLIDFSTLRSSPL